MSLDTTQPVRLSAASWPALSRRAVLAVALLAATGAGAAIGAATGTGTGSDAAFTELIRFMAIVKAAIVLAAAALVSWRLTSPASPRLAAGYIVCVSLMAPSPGLIWNMSSLLVASALFHSGLLFGLYLAATDGVTRRAGSP